MSLQTLNASAIALRNEHNGDILGNMRDLPSYILKHFRRGEPTWLIQRSLHPRAAPVAGVPISWGGFQGGLN
jgi:hypothetical protein